MEPGLLDEFGSLPVSPTLAGSLKRATEYARAQSHAEIALEHLLLSLIEDDDALRILRASGLETDRLNSDVSNHLGLIEDRLGGDGSQQPSVSEDVKNVLKGAAVAARGKRREIDGAIVLAAIVGDGKSAAAHILSAQGLTFEAAIQAIQSAPTEQTSGAAGFQHPSAVAQAAPPVQGYASQQGFYDAADDPIPSSPPLPGAAPANAVRSTSQAPTQPPPTRKPRDPNEIIAEARSKLRTEQHAPLSELSINDQPPRSQDVEETSAAETQVLPQSASQSPSTTIERPVLPQASLPKHSQPEANRPPEPRFEADVPTPNPHSNPAGDRPGYKLPVRPPPTDTNPLSPRPRPIPTAQPDSRRPTRPPASETARSVAPDLPPQPPALPPAPPPAARQPQPGGLQPDQTSPQSSAPDTRPPNRPYEGAPPAAAAQPPAQQTPGPPPGFTPVGNRQAPLQPPHLDPRQIQRDVAPPRPPNSGPPGQFQPGQHQTGGQRPPSPRQDRQYGQPQRFNTAPTVPSIQAEPFDRDVLLQAIPERMKSGRSTSIEVSIPRAKLLGLTDGGHSYAGISAPGNQGGGLSAVSIRLRAPDGDFFIENASPETQWINVFGPARGEELVTWRWTVTPKSSGRGALQLKTNSRSMGSDGVASETSLDGEVADVRISKRWGRAFASLLWFLFCVGLGVALGLVAVSIPLTESLLSMLSSLI
ncbi:MAG: Clp protease N-terminal domain-containing protein [Pseudomonadota bacterium]